MNDEGTQTQAHKRPENPVNIDPDLIPWIIEILYKRKMFLVPDNPRINVSALLL